MKNNEFKRSPRTRRTVLLALVLCAALIAGVLAACGTTDKENKDPSSAPPAETTGMKLNLYQPNPSQEALWQTLAADYKSLTGVEVAVISPKNNAPATELKEALTGEKDKPAIFLFTNPREYKAWQDHALDITNNKAYTHLIDSRLALTAQGKTIGLPLGVEAYGIVYNKKIMDAYFALENKETELKSIDDVTTHKELEALVKDMDKNKEALGITGVFASPALKEGESTNWTTRLLSVPLAYEINTNKVDITGDGINEIKLQNDKGYGAFYNLMLAHGTAEKDKLETRTYADAVGEFATGKAAMILGGSDLMGQINSAVGQTVQAEECAFLPVRMDIEGLKNQGLAYDAVEYAAVNSKLTEEEIQAAGEFLNWLLTSEKGMDFLANKLNVLAPYDTVTEESLPNNPLSANAFAWLKKEGVTHTVTYSVLTPGEEFRDKVMASGLLAYAKGESDWNKFKADVKTGWAQMRAKVDENF